LKTQRKNLKRDLSRPRWRGPLEISARQRSYFTFTATHWREKSFSTGLTADGKTSVRLSAIQWQSPPSDILYNLRNNLATGCRPKLDPLCINLLIVHSAAKPYEPLLSLGIHASSVACHCFYAELELCCPGDGSELLALCTCADLICGK